jgi:aspartate/methionine/tyrosine aminotransferase
MFQKTRYITWALQFYGKTPYDLATSGIPFASTSELEPVEPELFDDWAAYAELVDHIASYNAVSSLEVAPAMGTINAVFLAYSAMLSPGDEILVEHPGYEPLTRCAEGLGATVRTFSRPEERGFAIDPAEVAAKIGPRTRAIVVTSLHNPSGVRVPDETLKELALIAEARGAYLLVDEVYAPFDDLPEDGVFRKSARHLAPNVVAVSSLTKCYGLGLHRIGWLLGPKEIIEGASTATIATVTHMPATHAPYGVAAFQSIPKLARRAKAIVGNKRVIAADWVKSLPGARWSDPKEGLFGLVTLPGRGDLLPAVERIAKENGVLVGAGTFFGAPDSFRLSWASCDEEKFRKGLELLRPLADTSR